MQAEAIARLSAPESSEYEVARELNKGLSSYSAYPLAILACR